MAILGANYELQIDITYSNTGNTNTAESAINAALGTAGRPETLNRASTTVTLTISDLTESEAVSIRNAILSPWSGSTRTTARVALVRMD